MSITTSSMLRNVQRSYRHFARLRLERGLCANTKSTMNSGKPDTIEKDKQRSDDTEKKPVSESVSQEDDDEREMVDMWNMDAPEGPEWGGPEGYEPTRHGDWAKNGRVSDF